MVGAKIYGANTPDFRDKELLFTLNEVLRIYFQDYLFNESRKAYRYYRWEASGSHTYIGELEWLTLAGANIAESSALPIFTSLTGIPAAGKKKMKLLEKDGKKSEYDGNEETRGNSRTVSLQLEYAQIVTGVRMVPRNAANGIVPGDCYELMYWQKGWKSLGKK